LCILASFSEYALTATIVKLSGMVGLKQLMLERVFTANSNATSRLVAAPYAKEITLDPIAIAIFSLDQFLAAWGFDIAERLHYTQTQTSKYMISQEFHTQRRLLCELLSPWDPNYDPIAREQRKRISTVLSSQDCVLKETATYIRELASQGELWQPEEKIISSLMHVHLNRLLGVNREQKIYVIWRRTLESLQRRPAKKEAQ